MAGSAAEVNQPTFCEQINAEAVGESIHINLRLDVLFPDLVVVLEEVRRVVVVVAVPGEGGAVDLTVVAVADDEDVASGDATDSACGL